MKKIILGIFIGILVSYMVGVVALTTIPSNNVTYQNKTVNSVLDELYQKVMVNKVYYNGDVVYYNPETNKI